MTKEVLVKISGLQFEEENENGPIEIITTGNYYKKMESIIFYIMKSRKALMV